jgi:hypothetical protein
VNSGVLSFNLEGAPVEGMTNLLWTLLSAAWISLLPDPDPIVGARLLGALLHAATGALLTLLAAEICRDASQRAAALTATLFAAQGSMAFYAMSGLETPLWTFLFVCSLRALHQQRFGRLGLILSALAWTRPEGVLVGELLCLVAWRAQPKRALRTGAIFMTSLAILQASRLLYYGALVPNTFHAKSPEFWSGLDYLGTYWAYGLGLAGPLVLVPSWRRRSSRWMVAVIGVLVVAAVLSGGDWMPGWRRLSLCTTLFILLAGVGTAQVSRWRHLSLAGAIAMFLGASVSAYTGTDHGAYPHQQMARLGTKAAATPGVDTVALVDIGRFGWAFPGEVVDLVGLTDSELAQREGTHGNKTWNEAWFRGKQADLLIARSATRIADPLPGPLVLGAPERPMVRSVLQHGGYQMVRVEQHTEGQWMLIFARDGLVLPEAIWGPPTPKTLRRLLGG